MASIRKSYAGAAVATTLNGAIAGGATTIVVANGSSYPDGSGGKFVICIDRGLATEEKVLITSRSGNSMTVSNRGYDGTAAQAHSNGVVVEHVLDADTIDQANRLANLLTAAGDTYYRDGTDVQRLALGSAGLALVAGASAPAWGQVGTAGLSAAAIAALNAYADAAVAAEAVLRAAGDLANPRYSVGARRVANQAVATATITTILFDTEDWDTHGFFTPGLGVFVFPSNGLYLVTFDVAVADLTFFTAEAIYAGTRMAVAGPVNPPSSAFYAASGSYITSALAAQDVRINVSHAAGSNKNFTARMTCTRLSV